MNDKPQLKVSRRDAVKILAAAVGATALSNLPGKWTKPSLNVGILPAHALTSGHTLTVGADQIDNFCLSTALVSTVTISPADPGILMKYTIIPDPSITISSPPSLTGTALTNSSGVASLTFTAATSAAHAVTVGVEWEFANASDGTGNGTQLFTNLGC
jgi:hypothetical protein